MLPGLALLGALSACSVPAPLPTAPAPVPVPEEPGHAPFTVAVRCVESDVAAHFTEPQAVSGRSNALVHRDAEGRMDGYVLHPDAWWRFTPTPMPSGASYRRAVRLIDGTDGGRCCSALRTRRPVLNRPDARYQ